MIATLNQWCTYWPPGEEDNWGIVHHLPPQHLKCRYQGIMKLVRDKHGAEYVASHVFYLPQAVDMSGKLAYGIHHGEQVVAGAKEPRALSEHVGLDGTTDHWGVYV